MHLNARLLWWHDNYMPAQQVKFIRPPKKEVYGTVAVIEDLYGNLWDLLQPARKS